MKSYLQQLQKQAKEYNIPLIKAFGRAYLPSSTYYRTVQGKTDMRYETAIKVHHVLEELHLLQKTRDDPTRLRGHGTDANRRKVYPRSKSRIIGT